MRLFLLLFVLCAANIPATSKASGDLNVYVYQNGLIVSRTGAEFCDAFTTFYEFDHDWSQTISHSVAQVWCSYSDLPNPSNVYVDVTIHAHACHYEYIGGQHVVCDDDYVSQTADADIVSYFTSAAPLPESQCGLCIADPIDPTTGAVLSNSIDLPRRSDGAVWIGRAYSSATVSSSNFGRGWRLSYSRSVMPKYQSLTYRPYIQNDPNSSSQYDDASSACVSGFGEIKNRNSNWQDATASYSNGTCVISVSGVEIGTLPLYYVAQHTPSSPTALSGPTLVGFDAVRDDGQKVSFIVHGSVISSPPSINLKLQQASTGYLLTDANDTVESYDANGKLQSITNRNGVVQTLSYDSSGRLSSVTDNFGHSLSLSYDSDNHLLLVTRQ